MAKNIDGIKKISKEEVERSRKIVLDYIGEEDERKTKLDKEPITLKYKKPAKLDSLSGREKKNVKELSEVNRLKKVANLSDRVKDFSVKKPKAELIKEGPGEVKQEKDKMQLSEEEQQRLMEKTKKYIPKKENSEKGENKKTDFKAIKEKGEDKSKKQKEIKKEKSLKRKPAELKIENKKKPKKKKNHKFINLIKKFFVFSSFRSIIKIFIFIVVCLFTLFIIFYLIFSLLLIKFNYDTSITRRIAKCISVPAVVSEVGIIKYYDYIDKTNYLLNNGKSINGIKEAILRDLIISKLSKEKKLVEKTNLDSLLNKELNKIILKDKEINKVAFLRVEDIKEKIKINDFVEVGEKYGDESGYYYEAVESKLIYDETRDLANGQLKEILSDDGYYLVKNEKQNILFIFIRGINLDDYLNEEVKNVKAWFLVD
ncbi:MAG: hypothetical protein ABIG60_03140 [Patescibacteria group bacterium]